MPPPEESARPTTSVPAADHPDDRLPLWIQVYGWYGTLAILGAYFALSHDLLEEGLLYQLLNITGATGVGLVAWRKRAWQPFCLELVWVAVGVSALIT